MATKTLPDQDVLLQLLDYNPQTGKLTWKPRGVEMFPAKTPARSRALCALWNERYAGFEAFTCVVDGYRTGAIGGINYKAHRVIWKMQTGEDAAWIDHENGGRGNNRWRNLRNVTQSQNAKNRKIPKNNRSGVIGICRWAHNGHVYWAVTTPKKKSDTYFKCFGQAVVARKAVEITHDFHPNHGRAA